MKVDKVELLSKTRLPSFLPEGLGCPKFRLTVRPVFGSGRAGRKVETFETGLSSYAFHVERWPVGTFLEVGRDEHGKVVYLDKADHD